MKLSMRNAARGFVMMTMMGLPLTLLSGCGKSTDEQVSDGNAKLDRMSAINGELTRKGIVVRTRDGAEDLADSLALSSMKGLNSADLQQVIDLLNEYMSSTDGALAAMDSNNVVYTGNRADLLKWKSRAATLLQQAKSVAGRKSNGATNSMTDGSSKSVHSK